MTNDKLSLVLKSLWFILYLLRHKNAVFMNSRPLSNSIMNNIKQPWEALASTWRVRQESWNCGVVCAGVVGSKWVNRMCVGTEELKVSSKAWCSFFMSSRHLAPALISQWRDRYPVDTHTRTHSSYHMAHLTDKWCLRKDERDLMKRVRKMEGAGGDEDLRSSDTPRANMWWMMDGMSFLEWLSMAILASAGYR